VGNLIRKQLYITLEQENFLKQKAKKMGITQAELVREALDSHTYTVDYNKRNIEKWQEEVEFIKTGMLPKDDSHKGQTWKREDLYDR